MTIYIKLVKFSPKFGQEISEFNFIKNLHISKNQINSVYWGYFSVMLYMLS